MYTIQLHLLMDGNNGKLKLPKSSQNKHGKYKNSWCIMFVLFFNNILLDVRCVSFCDFGAQQVLAEYRKRRKGLPKTRQWKFFF